MIQISYKSINIQGIDFCKHVNKKLIFSTLACSPKTTANILPRNDSYIRDLVILSAQEIGKYFRKWDHANIS